MFRLFKYFCQYIELLLGGTGQFRSITWQLPDKQTQLRHRHQRWHKLTPPDANSARGRYIPVSNELFEAVHTLEKNHPSSHQTLPVIRFVSSLNYPLAFAAMMLKWRCLRLDNAGEVDTTLELTHLISTAAISMHRCYMKACIHVIDPTESGLYRVSLADSVLQDLPYSRQNNLISIKE